MWLCKKVFRVRGVATLVRRVNVLHRCKQMWGPAVSTNESGGYGGICTPCLWVQTQSVCADDPMPLDNEPCTLIQSRWANRVESRAGICWSFILFLSLPFFCLNSSGPFLSVFLPSCFACSKTKQRKCNKYFSWPKSKGMATFFNAHRGNRKSHEGMLTCDFRSVC